MDYKYQGIILSKLDVAEVDRIYHIYTREAGKIRVLGKGVRNPNAKLAGHLEPITRGEIFVAKSRGMGKITGAITEEMFSGIKNDLVSVSRTFYIFQIMEKLIAEQEGDERIFSLLSGFLDALEKISTDEADEKKDIVTSGFLFKFLDFSGYRIEVEKCMKCGEKLKNEINYFSSERGGFVCGACRDKIGKGIRTTAGTIKLARIFLNNEIRNFGKISASKEDAKNIRSVGEEMVKWIIS